MSYPTTSEYIQAKRDFRDALNLLFATKQKARGAAFVSTSDLVHEVSNQSWSWHAKDKDMYAILRVPTIGQYLLGRSLPTRKYLNTLAAVLGVEPTDLVPAHMVYDGRGRRATADYSAKSAQARALERQGFVLVNSPRPRGRALVEFKISVPQAVANTLVPKLQALGEKLKGSRTPAPDQAG